MTVILTHKEFGSQLKISSVAVKVNPLTRTRELHVRGKTRLPLSQLWSQHISWLPVSELDNWLMETE